jgi:hypothetical protein
LPLTLLWSDIGGLLPDWVSPDCEGETDLKGNPEEEWRKRLLKTRKIPPAGQPKTAFAIEIKH